MLLKKLSIKESESSRDFAYRSLKESIMELYLPPNTAISEITISKELELSRTPVREAFLLLEANGLIFVQPKIGTFVSKINTDHIYDAIYMRKIIENNVLLQVLEIDNKHLLEELAVNLASQKLLLSLDSLDTFTTLDNAFHKAIYKSIQKDFVWKKIQDANYSLNRIRKLDVLNKPKMQLLIEEHEQLIEIIRENKAELLDPFLDRHLNKLNKDLPIFKAEHPQYFE